LSWTDIKTIEIRPHIVHFRIGLSYTDTSEVGWSCLGGHFTFESLINQFGKIGFQKQLGNGILAPSATDARYNTRATVAFNIIKQLLTSIL
jgi:hypothetical protein